MGKMATREEKKEMKGLIVFSVVFLGACCDCKQERDLVLRAVDAAEVCSKQREALHNELKRKVTQHSNCKELNKRFRNSCTIK